MAIQLLALNVGDVLVRCVEVGMNGRLNDVGACAGATVIASVEAHRYMRFTEGILARRGGANLELFQFAGMPQHFLNGNTGGMHRTVACSRLHQDFFATAQFHKSDRRVLPEGTQLFKMIGLEFFIVQVHNQHTQVIGVYFLLSVGQYDEPLIQLVHLLLRKVKAQFSAALSQAGASRMLAQDQVAAAA